MVKYENENNQKNITSLNNKNVIIIIFFFTYASKNDINNIYKI